jgi:hypothetical protein
MGSRRSPIPRIVHLFERVERSCMQQASRRDCLGGRLALEFRRHCRRVLGVYAVLLRLYSLPGICDTARHRKGGKRSATWPTFPGLAIVASQFADGPSCPIKRMPVRTAWRQFPAPIPKDHPKSGWPPGICDGRAKQLY